MSVSRWLGATLSAAALVSTSPATAAEGGASNYLPGAYGDFGLAVANAPGFEMTLAGVAAIGLQGDIVDPATAAPASLDVDANSLTASLVWTSQPFGHSLVISAGLTLPYTDIETRAALNLGVFGVQNLRDDNDGFGDVVLNPLSLYGAVAVGEATDLYWSLAEYVTAPTGKHSAARISNPGRDHWTFDTVLAASLIDEAAGYEIAAAGGFMINTKSGGTNYKSGAEAHLDLVANVLVGDGVALGATVYGVAQIERDRGAVGPSPPKGQAWGAGLQAFWTPDPERFTPSVRLKWLRDLEAEDRLKGDYVFLIVDFPL